MRKTLLFLLTSLLVASSAKGVSASPDCQRWLADYKHTLAEKSAAQHLLAARDRARRAARRRLAQLTTTPHPVHPPTRISSTRPHLSPVQMLKRFDLLCGDLPVEEQVLDGRMGPEELISEIALGGPLEVEAPADSGTLIAENALPTLPFAPFAPGQQGSALVPTSPVFAPIFGGGGIVPQTPGSPSGPARPGTPAGPPTVTPIVPLAPVPEPSSVVLVVTGLVTALAIGGKRTLA